MGASVATGASVTTIKKSLPDIGHGGNYVVTHKNDQLIFAWGREDRGVAILVSREKEAIAASLLRHNVTSSEKRHYNAKRDGHLDILIEDETVRISDINTKRHRYGSTVLTRALFAAMRVYAANTGKSIKSAIVEISSTQAKSLYHCYVKAFRKNGFNTAEKEPADEHADNFMLIFTRYVYNEPQINV